MALGNVHVTSWKVVPHPYRKSYSSWYSAVPSRGHILADQTGSFWIVWYVIGLLHHILIYSSQPFLCFKNESLGWKCCYVRFHEGRADTFLYDALDGGAGWGTAGRKAPIPKIHIILVNMKPGYKGLNVINLPPSVWMFPVRDGTQIGSSGLVSVAEVICGCS